MDIWDPCQDDFTNEKINSYNKGPGKNLVGKRGYTNEGQKHVQLYVRGIPLEIDEDGLRNLFSRAGKVVRVKKVISKRPESGDTFGFVTMATVTDAEKAIRELDNFRIERFTLRVKVALSEEEKKRKKDEREEQESYFAQQSASGDIEQEIKQDRGWQRPVMNGGGVGDAISRVMQGVGRGQVRQQLQLEVGPGGDGHLTQPNGHVSGLVSPAPSMGPLEDLSITVNREPLRSMTDDYRQDNTKKSLLGDYSSGNKSRLLSPLGRGAGRGNIAAELKKENMNIRGRGSRGGYRPRGGHLGGGYNRNRYSDYSDPYDSGYGTYPSQPYGRGMPFAGYAPPAMYAMPHSIPVDPYYGMVPGLSQHLLQPAYSHPMMNSSMMATPAINTTSMNKTVLGQEKADVSKQDVSINECSVCGQQGTSRCSRCKLPYCSEKCQVEDWANHKHVCKIIGRETEQNKAFENRFDVNVGDELIPQVKQLMEKAIGEKIEITRKGKPVDDRNKSGDTERQVDLRKGRQSSSRADRQKDSKTDRQSDSSIDRQSDPRNVTQHVSKNDRNCDSRKDKTETNDSKRHRDDKSRCSGDKKVCFNCGESDHMRSDCPKPRNWNMKCYNCQKVGHASKECPLKPENQKTPVPSVSESVKDDDWDNKPVSTPKMISKKSSKPLAESTPKDVPFPPKNTAKTVVGMKPSCNLTTATLPLNEEVEVCVTEAIDPSQIWVQLNIPEYIEPLAAILRTMAQKYTSGVCDVSSVSVGEYYAVQFSQDQTWYRAQIKSVHGNDIVVQFVDFGNQETTSLDKMRQLDPSLMNHPAQGIPCCLAAVSPVKGSQWNILAGRFQAYVVQNAAYCVTCTKECDKSTSKMFEVTMKNDKGEDIAENLVSSGLAKYSSSCEITDSPLMVNDLETIFSTLTIGHKVPVMVTDAASPISFNVQVLEDSIKVFSAFNEKFNKLYNSDGMETEYRPYAVGELVASRFSGDDEWYRAEVIQMTDKSAKVVFIDYGNFESVSFHRLRKALPICGTVPKQAVPCCMFDVTAPADGQWPDEVSQLYASFSASALQGVVKGIKNNIVSMELISSDGKSISEKIQSILSVRPKVDKLVKQAESPVSSLQKPTCTIKSATLSLDGTKVEASATDISYLNGFYMQLGDAESHIELGKLMLELNEDCKSVTPCVPSEGDFVAVQYCDGESTMWYRAKIEQEIDDKTYKVFFIDYGNSKVMKVEAMTELKSKFMALHSMVVCCQLVGSEGNTDPQALKDFNVMLNTLTLIKAVALVDGVYQIEMYLPDGSFVNEIMGFSSSKIVSPVPAMTSPTTPIAESPSPMASPITIAQMDIVGTSLPLDGSKVDAAAVFIENLASFYIQLADTDLQGNLAKLMGELNKHCNKSIDIYTPVVGEFVAAPFNDGQGTLWYRAQVVDIGEVEIKVLFVDYGNTDLVEKQNIRELDKQFVDLPLMAIKCRLAWTDGTENDKVAEFYAIMNLSVKIKALERHKETDVYTVEMYLTDADENCVNSILGVFELPLNESEKEGIQCPKSPVYHQAQVSDQPSDLMKIQYGKLDIGVQYLAATMEIESVYLFYIQMADEQSQQHLASMMIEVNDFCNKSSTDYQPSVGEFVGAQFNDGGDTLWYRALIEEKIDDERYLARFIDYGNTDTVNSKVIRKLDSKYMSTPQMAFKCKLIGMKTENNSILKEFKTCAMNIEMKVCIKSFMNDVYTVDMVTSDGKHMSDILELNHDSVEPTSPSTLLVDQLPKAITPVKDILPRKEASPPSAERKVVFSQTVTSSRPMTEMFKAVITSIVRPNKFYCQVWNDDNATLSDLKILSDTMKLEYENDLGEVDHEFEVGELCCAKFPDDGEWYRATILNIFPDKTVKVEYVDFGNQTEVATSLLRPVTEEFTRLPLLAIKCTLHGVAPVGPSWTEEAMIKMTQFQDIPLVAHVKSVENDVYEVELADGNGNDLAQHLITSGVAKTPMTESPDMLSVVQREKELLQKQLELMQAQMAELLKKK